MSGIVGVVSRENCVGDLFKGTFYVQHRAQNYCGFAVDIGGKPYAFTHHGLVTEGRTKKRLKEFNAGAGIGCVAGERQPVSELSNTGGMVVGFDGNVLNYQAVKEGLLKGGETFSGFNNPDEVPDNVLVSKILSKADSFEKGVERLFEIVEGDFAIVALTTEGVYGARGWGRKPLITGKREDGTYAISSESNSFMNSGISIFRDVRPGEVVLLNKEGIHQVKQFKLDDIKFGTFEWIYTAYPSSIIDGRSVSQVRKNMGKLLARRYPIKADIVSPIPNSGRWHALGYAQESKIPYEDVFIRYDYSDRSFTQMSLEEQQEMADLKLIPVPFSLVKGMHLGSKHSLEDFLAENYDAEDLQGLMMKAKDQELYYMDLQESGEIKEGAVEGRSIVVVDDSIVRGVQTKNQTLRLKKAGAREIHARIACPPLMTACHYGKTTKKDEHCVARVMSVEDIQRTRGLDSLGYATIEDLELGIGLPQRFLCLDCWSL